MPRQARLDVPGALHHIMVRGINRSDSRSGRRRGVCFVFGQCTSWELAWPNWPGD